MNQMRLTAMTERHNPPVDPLTAFSAARRRFLAGERIAMCQIASELGVSRATLFRWVGSRDELHAQIIWSLTKPAFARAISATRNLAGGRRVAAVLTQLATEAIASEPLMEFVQHEPERALRILATDACWLQAKVASLVEDMIRIEVNEGRLVPSLPPRDLAYLATRIAGALVCAGAVAGIATAPEEVRVAVDVVLRDQTRP